MAALMLAAATVSAYCVPPADAFSPTSIHVHVPSSAPSRWQQQQQLKSAASNDEGGGEAGAGGPGWIRDAMSDDSDGTGGDERKVEPGLAGFAVDPELGFLAIVAADNDGDDASGDRQQEHIQWFYSVVSPQDKTQLMAAESLTLVQLAGDIDVGAAVLPPEALLQIVREEVLDEEDEDEQVDESEIVEATLAYAEAVPRAMIAPKVIDGAAENQSVESSPEREARISQDAPKLFGTIRTLPGLAEATEQSVKSAMLTHASEDGSIDRAAFTQILDTLRRNANAGARQDLAGVDFALTVQIRRENGKQGLIRVRSPSTFHALGLAMRYNCSIVISQDCVDGSASGASSFGGCGRDELLGRFPAFRPIQELKKDAEAVDAFIANMFYKQNPPRAFE